MVKPEDLVKAYQEYTAAGDALSDKNWGEWLEAFNKGEGQHPQDIRRANVARFKEARKTFFDLMNQLVKEYTE